MRTITNPETQKDMVAYLVNCNNCGHCSDLSSPKDSDAPILTLTRKKILTQLTTWLAATKTEVSLPSFYAFLE